MPRLLLSSGLVAALFTTACTAPEHATISVRLVDVGDQPLPGRTVFGHGPGGSHVAEVVTDAAGVATLSVPAGGSITARDADNPALPGHWFTVLGVEDGDDLRIPFPRGTVARRDLVLTVPPLPPSATRFEVSVPCSGAGADPGATQTFLSLHPDCPDHGPLVAIAIDGDDPVGYLELDDVDLSGPTLAVTGAWTPPTHSFTFDVTGFPAGGGDVQVARAALHTGYALAATGAVMSTSSSSATHTGPRPAIGDNVIHRLLLETPDDTCGLRARTYTRARAADMDEFQVDLGDLKPELATITLADHQLAWTGGGGDTSALHVRFTARVQDGETLPGPDRTWTVLAPPGTSAITFPADVGYAWPTGIAGDDADSAWVTDIGATYWPSYADARQRVASPPLRFDGDLVERTSALSRLFSLPGCQ